MPHELVWLHGENSLDLDTATSPVNLSPLNPGDIVQWVHWDVWWRYIGDDAAAWPSEQYTPPGVWGLSARTAAQGPPGDPIFDTDAYTVIRRMTWKNETSWRTDDFAAQTFSTRNESISPGWGQPLGSQRWRHEFTDADELYIGWGFATTPPNWNSPVLWYVISFLVSREI